YHAKGITFDAYRTTGAGRQTHTIRNVTIRFIIRNSSASPVFLFTVDPNSGNEVAAGSLLPNLENQSWDVKGELKPSTTWRIKNAAGAVLKTYVTTTETHQGVKRNANPLGTMANYTHVQFISGEVNSGPNRGPSRWPRGIDGKGYPGIGTENAPENRLDVEGQIEDITE